MAIIVMTTYSLLVVVVVFLSSLLLLISPRLQYIQAQSQATQGVVAADADADVDAATRSKRNKCNNRKKKKMTKTNILLLLTDDQDVELGSFNTKEYMPMVHSLLREQGVTFEHGAFVHTPVCCPSRSSLLTGRYLHHGALAHNNSIEGNCYGGKWKEWTEPNDTFAVHAKAAGYTTLYAGKYLNQYHGYNTTHPESSSIPKGWDYWYGLEGNSRYYNYTIVEQRPSPNDAQVIGAAASDPTILLHKHGDTYPDDYLPLVLQNYSLEKIALLPEPWLAVIAWPTPHGPFTPEPKYSQDYPDVQAPHGVETPNYNASTASQQQKHWLLRQLGIITNRTAHRIDNIYRNRLRALKTVDNHVGKLVDLLGGGGGVTNNTAAAEADDDVEEKARSVSSMLDRTVIIYTSDNGFQFGQHRLAIDKVRTRRFYSLFF